MIAKVFCIWNENQWAIEANNDEIVATLSWNQVEFLRQSLRLLRNGYGELQAKTSQIGFGMFDERYTTIFHLNKLSYRHAEVFPFFFIVQRSIRFLHSMKAQNYFSSYRKVKSSKFFGNKMSIWVIRYHRRNHSMLKSRLWMQMMTMKNLEHCKNSRTRRYVENGFSFALFWVLIKLSCIGARKRKGNRWMGWNSIYHWQWNWWVILCVRFYRNDCTNGKTFLPVN